MYAHDLGGLIHCYVAALPFLYNTVAGDMLWTTLLFATWWSAKFLLAPKVNFSMGGKFGLLPHP
jgi:hypothetical protein